MATNRTAIPQGARDFLATGPLAHVVTINPDGRPHVSLAWAGFEGDELVFATFQDQPKIDNLRRNPRVVVSFHAKAYEGQGLWPYLVVGGRATVIEGGAPGVMDYLAQFYIGPGAKYPMRNMPDGLTVRVAIDRIYGQGPWREGK